MRRAAQQTEERRRREAAEEAARTQAAEAARLAEQQRLDEERRRAMTAVVTTRPRRVTTPVAIAWGVAGAGAIAGGIMGALALSAQSSFEADRGGNARDDAASRGSAMAVGADVAFGTAAVAGVLGLVLFFTQSTTVEATPMSSSQAGNGSGGRSEPAVPELDASRFRNARVRRQRRHGHGVPRRAALGWGATSP